MDGKLLLDTSAVIELFRGGPGTDRLLEARDRSLLSVIAIGELLRVRCAPPPIAGNRT